MAYYDQRRLVSDARTMPTSEYTLAVAQNQTRLEHLTTDGSTILYLRLARQANCLPLRREPVSDVASW